MGVILEALRNAFGLIVALDPDMLAIVCLSLQVSLSAVAIATVLALPLGAVLAVGRFPGRRATIVLLNALMGLPPVVVGLVVYLLLSRAGPLGEFGILFTPAAMVIAQTILIAPIMVEGGCWLEIEGKRSMLQPGAGTQWPTMTLNVITPTEAV